MGVESDEVAVFPAFDNFAWGWQWSEAFYSRDGENL